MATVNDDDLTIELAHDVLTRIAPEELALFPVTSELYRKNPDAVQAQAGKDEVLGFGADVLVALTPVVLSVAGVVTNCLLEQVRAAAEEESASAIRRMVRWLLKPVSSDPREDLRKPTPLSTHQLRAVRDAALEHARRLQVPEEQAQLLADAMVGGLVTA